MKKKFGICIVVMLLVASILSGCSNGGNAKESSTESKDKDLRIGLTLMDYNFAFFQDMLAMAKYTADELGVEVIDIDAVGDVQKQLQGVEDLIMASDVDALFLNPVDSEAISPATLDANDQDIPVVTVDVRSSQGEVVAHVASNNLEIGRQAGKYAVELLKERNGSEKGTVFILGFPQITSIRDRAEGFKEIISQYPDIKLIEKSPIGLNVQDASDVWEDQMQALPEGSVDIVYGSNETNAVGILSATEAANRTDFAIIGVDDTPVLNAALENPKSPYAASVVQSPTDMGKLGIELAVKAAKGEAINEKEIATPVRLVNKETYDSYKQEMAELQEMIKKYK